jgi:hypothetical protein
MTWLPMYLSTLSPLRPSTLHFPKRQIYSSTDRTMLAWFAALVAASALVPGAHAHTWIEQLISLDQQGQYVGEYGYSRGFVDKATPGFVGEQMQWLLPTPEEKSLFISESSVLCHPDQRKQQQRDQQHPRLKTTPGSFIALRYTENGHVTLLDDDTNRPKPKEGGTVFMYGTTEPKEDETLMNVLRWTADGQGGDKRGVLLGTNNYDDGRCYELNSSPLSTQRQGTDPNFAKGQAGDGPGNFPMYCESDVQLPKDAPTGKPYTLYWVWQWNTMPGKNPGEPEGKDQYYTTCIDIDLTDTAVAKSSDGEQKFGIMQQDAMSEAVPDWNERTALYTEPAVMEAGPAFSEAGDSSPQPTPTTLITQTSPPPEQPAPTDPPTGGQPAPGDGIPNMTDRPGRPQPSETPYNETPPPAEGQPPADGVPVMDERPGRPQPAEPPASAEPNQPNEGEIGQAPGEPVVPGQPGPGEKEPQAPVTVTSTVIMTVTAGTEGAQATPPPAPMQIMRYGSRVRRRTIPHFT